MLDVAASDCAISTLGEKLTLLLMIFYQLLVIMSITNFYYSTAYARMETKDNSYQKENISPLSKKNNGGEKCFRSWVSTICHPADDKIVSIDGKTLRGSKSGQRSAIHMVSAWAHEQQLVLGQVATDEKSNEMTAVPNLLEVLDLKGCIVTADAASCQKHDPCPIVTTDSFGGNAGNVFSAICCLQKSRFTSSKPSIFAIASGEKSICHRTTA